MVSIASASTQNETPSLDLILEAPMTIHVGSSEIKLSGPFANTPDGKKGLAIGGASNVLQIPMPKQAQSFLLL
jgi:hypothetical protein